jgi:hypothetical protein
MTVGKRPTNIKLSNIMKGYIQNPQTIEEAAHNVKFQCDNVSSWLHLKDYQCAKIKADCMMDAFEVLNRMIREEEDHYKQRQDDHETNEQLNA